MVRIRDKRDKSTIELGEVARYTFINNEYGGEIALITENGYVVFLNRSEIEMAGVCFEQVDDGKGIVLWAKCFGCVRGKKRNKTDRPTEKVDKSDK